MAHYYTTEFHPIRFIRFHRNETEATTQRTTLRRSWSEVIFQSSESLSIAEKGSRRIWRGGSCRTALGSSDSSSARHHRRAPQLGTVNILSYPSIYRLLNLQLLIYVSWFHTFGLIPLGFFYQIIPGEELQGSENAQPQVADSDPRVPWNGAPVMG